MHWVKFNKHAFLPIAVCKSTRKHEMLKHLFIEILTTLISMHHSKD